MSLIRLIKNLQVKFVSKTTNTFIKKIWPKQDINVQRIQKGLTMTLHSLLTVKHMILFLTSLTFLNLTVREIWVFLAVASLPPSKAIYEKTVNIIKTVHKQ